ncbi:MAG: IS1595 family transposase [Anaerolineales bacterium]|nr:IS1595 family transposase [Anaerolineales bacterium]
MTENEAREFLENLRWPNGPVCPHCGHDVAHKLSGKVGSKKPVRPGVYACAQCRKQFTVTVGTIFESSRIPLRKWLMAFYLMNASKKGISAHQLHRMLGITYKTAWFMCHRIRESMRKEPVSSLLEGVVEADETYIGGKESNKHLSKRSGKRGRSTDSKTPVFALVERGGELRAGKVANVGSATLPNIIRRHVHPDATLMTDSFNAYASANEHVLFHEAVDHSRKEYVRGNVHVNTLEGWFSLLKRGINGTFHHVSEKHLDRYIDEFVHRYNWREMDDVQRTIKALKGAPGKRLYYKEPKQNLDG